MPFRWRTVLAWVQVDAHSCKWRLSAQEGQVAAMRHGGDHTVEEAIARVGEIPGQQCAEKKQKQTEQRSAYDQQTMLTLSICSQFSHLILQIKNGFLTLFIHCDHMRQRFIAWRSAGSVGDIGQFVQGAADGSNQLCDSAELRGLILSAK